MRAAIVLVITAAILAAQYQFGLRRWKLPGAVIPVGIAVVLTAADLSAKTVQNIPVGIVCALALFAVWGIGYFRSSKYEKEALDKMKTKDL